ncbi:allantoicase-like [Schistocerca nitens]|uniref:allantoicase-like n=1 Tax=Schistocerca nitens TaxID=7011 RepID=UPI002118C88A|nr:allantoicase-like [Schistocerca nitens]
MDTQTAFTQLNDLCAERNGGQVLFATDDWFAVAENLIKEEPPEWREGEFTECGKWMDGWETRRRRTPGHDWAILRLGVPGVLRGVTVDTAYFTGNFAPRFSLQAANLSRKDEACIPSRDSHIGNAATPEMMKEIQQLDSQHWTEIVPMTALKPGYPETRYNHFTINSDETWTHVRLNMFPDGGIARLHLYGEARPDWKRFNINKLVDLLLMKNGGVCLGCSDAHFGHPRNIIRPGPGINMGDGWETARRLDRPAVLEEDARGILQVLGSEWAIFRMGHPGTIGMVEVDTAHFKGNYPDSIRIEGVYFDHQVEDTVMCENNNVPWKTLLPPQKLFPHKQHLFSKDQLRSKGPFTHVRVTIAPDGGISRLRLWGYVEV